MHCTPVPLCICLEQRLILFFSVGSDRKMPLLQSKKKKVNFTSNQGLIHCPCESALRTCNSMRGKTNEDRCCSSGMYLLGIRHTALVSLHIRCFTHCLHMSPCTLLPYDAIQAVDLLVRICTGRILPHQLRQDWIL